MKFSYNTGIFHLRPLSEAIAVMARAGFFAVELMADRAHAFPDELTAAQIADINRCLEERRIGICNLDSTAVAPLGETRRPSWIEEDWKKREGWIRYTLDCLRLAAAMGIRSVSTMAGGQIPQTMKTSR